MADPMNLFITFSIIFQIFCYIPPTICHVCQHKIPTADEIIHGVKVEHSHVLNKRSVSQPMRISVIYDTSFQDLTAAKRDLIKNDVLPAAVQYWEQTLSVRKSSTAPIKLLRACVSSFVTYKQGEDYYCVNGCSDVTQCGEVQIPADHLMACRQCDSTTNACSVTGTEGAGVSGTDFILYVSTKNADRCGYGSTVAYAAYCQLESSLDRPVAGYVNICPNSISTESFDHGQVVATIKHEILHALGFSAGLFAFYRDDNGQPLTPRVGPANKPIYNNSLQLYQWSDRVVKAVDRTRWRILSGNMKRTVQMIVTPRVVNEVRAHFNCSTLEGAELENQGIVGTALTHFEKRVFENEAMTGTYTQNPVISRITLALMEDTGWYHADYSQADIMEWGKNLGCDFVTQSCLDWMVTKQALNQSVHPFCNRVRSQTELRTECTTDRRAVALCNLVEYQKDLEPQYQYVARVDGVAATYLTKYGGSVELADFCPYIQEFAWKENNVVVRSSRCVDAPQSADKNYALESFGTGSICIEQATHWLVRQCSSRMDLDNWGSGCYKFQCTIGSGLSLLVGDKSYPCQKAGDIVTIRQLSSKYLHEGTLVCPACSNICADNIASVCINTAKASVSDQSPADVLTIPCGGATSHRQLLVSVVVVVVCLCLMR